jgi:hypothetical protein
MYTSYDVAHQLLQVRNYTDLAVTAFAELPRDVLSAVLRLTAEWRNVEEMEWLIVAGACPKETHEGFTVLDEFLMGHDGYWTTKDCVKQVEAGVKMLAKYGVTDKDLTAKYILSNCKEIIQNSEYLMKFFKVEIPKVKLFYHLPRSGKLEQAKLNNFTTVEEVVKTLACLTNYPQYVAVIEEKGEVWRYLVSKGCGLLEVIPLADKPGWTETKEALSNIVNFAMGNTDEYPTLPCEDE